MICVALSIAEKDHTQFIRNPSCGERDAIMFGLGGGIAKFDLISYLWWRSMISAACLIFLNFV